MISHYNFKRFTADTYLLTNDLGDYCFLPVSEFEKLVFYRDKLSEQSIDALTASRILIDGSYHHFVDENVPYARDCKNYVFSSTSLHIFVVTTQCNHRCIYCQANNGQPLYDVMDAATAERAVDIALQSPAMQLSFEMQGGEPLLNFPVIKRIVEYSEQKRGEKQVSFSVVTNLTLLTDEMIHFFCEHKVSISTSVDGDEVLHNANRPYANGKGSFHDVMRSVERARTAGLQIGAIQTTTRMSLPYATEIVDAYSHYGFSSIFVRPLTPLGCAKRRWKTIGYTEEEYVQFYREVFEAILKKCQRGQHIQENYATILLSNILQKYPANYMELRSPCGAGLGQMAYYTNGDVFTCDEGRMLFEMGNDSFRLGNVFNNSYHDLIKAPACRATCLASTTESVPSCCDCVYQPYCGLCPVINLALYGDLVPKEPNHYRCKINTGILDYLFALIQLNDDDTMNILYSWRL